MRLILHPDFPVKDIDLVIFVVAILCGLFFLVFIIDSNGSIVNLIRYAYTQFLFISFCCVVCCFFGDSFVVVAMSFFEGATPPEGSASPR